MIAGGPSQVRAVIQKQPHHVDVTVANRKQQRRHPSVGRRQSALPDDPVAGRSTRTRRHIFALRQGHRGVSIDIGAALRAAISLRPRDSQDRPHERGLCVNGVLRI